MKAWSYEELTEKAEQQIKSMMTSQSPDEETRRITRLFAFGVYTNWYGTTVGYQKEGDNYRLLRLTESES